DTAGDIRARLLANLSRARMRADRDAETLEAADAALAIAERLGLDEVIANALNNKASSMRRIGRPRESRALMEAAIQIAHAGGFVSAELRARSNLASVSWAIEPVASHEMQVVNLELARRVGNRTMALWIAVFVITGWWMRGREWDAALAVAEEALADSRSAIDTSRIESAQSLILTARGVPTDGILERLEAVAASTTDEE